MDWLPFYPEGSTMGRQVQENRRGHIYSCLIMCSMKTLDFKRCLVKSEFGLSFFCVRVCPDVDACDTCSQVSSCLPWAPLVHYFL